MQIIAMSLVPESPYSLLVFGKIQEARSALKWFAGTILDEDIEEEFRQLQTEARNCLQLRSTLQMSDIISWNLWKPCSIPIILMILQQFTGVRI